MKRAILLTGFNNWGKTTHIHNLFGRQRFYRGDTYRISDVNASFTVQSQSNDDLSEQGFIEVVNERIKVSPDKGKDIFCAFCPTREPNNDSKRILTGKPFSSYDEIHMLLLKYKWDFHAELRIKDIKDSLASVSNITYSIIDDDANHVADSQRCQAKEARIVSYLRGIYL